MVPPSAGIFQRLTDGSWTDVTCAEAAAQIRSAALGLIAEGVQAGDRVAILSATRYEWVILDYAILSVGAVTVPIYETSSAEQVRWVLEASRSMLESEADKIRRKLDVPARVRGSLRQHPSAWLLGSLATGLAASFLFRRKPSADKKRRGIAGILLGLTLTAARPFAKVWLAGQLKQWIAAIPDSRPVRAFPPNPNPL